MDALIGHTGFVGSHFARHGHFEAKFNSRTIGEAKGHAFGTVVCAAAPGSMFLANHDPECDRASLLKLQAQLSGMRAERFVLISSIAVLDRLDGGYDETNARYETEVPYGLHRRQLEEFVLDRFAGACVVRLPALFGAGIKKNFLFDILNPNPTMLMPPAFERTLEGLPAGLRDVPEEVYDFDTFRNLHVIDRARLAAHPQGKAFRDAIRDSDASAMQFYHPASTFQFYDMRGIHADCWRALEHSHAVIHVAPEPLTTAVIHRAATGHPMQHANGNLHREDMWTALSDLWSWHVPYSHDARTTLERIVTFINDQWRGT